MRGKRIMVSLVGSLVFATFGAIPSAQAQEVSASRAEAAAVPVQVRPATDCGGWVRVDKDLLAGVCISRFSDGRYRVRASVFNRSNPPHDQHTVAVFVGFRVAGREFLGGQCGFSVDKDRRTMFCDSRPATIRATGQLKFGVARVVHTDGNAQVKVRTPRGLM